MFLRDEYFLTIGGCSLSVQWSGKVACAATGNTQKEMILIVFKNIRNENNSYLKF